MDEYTKELMGVFTPPFKHIDGASIIIDANDRHVLDIRGWGFLSNQIGQEAATSVQWHLGEWLAKELTNQLQIDSSESQ